MSKKDFLLEVGMEEMPARFVTDAMNQLKNKVEEWLTVNKIGYNTITAFSTPRRLALLIDGLVEKQEDIEEEARGPARKIALDSDGNWTKAAEGFARGQGVSTNELFFQEIKGQEYVFAKKFIAGKETKELLPQLGNVITSLHFPKNMRWSNYELKFVRPIQWLVSLFGDEVIPFTITDITTDRITYGHRFLAKRIEIKDPKSYKETLLQGFVIVEPQERKKAIFKQIQHIEEENNWNIPINEDLLEEVTNLVEYPTALYGSFDESFLEVPEEVLITSMREHQRYFPVQDKKGALLPHFVTVRNGDHHHLDNVVRGNEKVLRARLSDAQFFYREDQKLNIEDALSQLENIVYHEELGSIGDKVRRIHDIAERLTNLLHVSEKEEVSRTARLCKFDLVTQMVYEFPELQGRMGEEYALKAGESPLVAQAINEHYMPRFSGDNSPKSIVGTVVSIADKMDTVATCFAIGLIPTGSQDPYALRRQAAGIIQMILDHKLDLKLDELIKTALSIAEKKQLLKRSKEDVFKELVDFFSLRIKNSLQEQGVRYDVIDAVLGKELKDISIIVAKAKLIMEQLETASFKRLVETLSRVTNISSKANSSFMEIDESLFEKEEEQVLYHTYKETDTRIREALENGNVEKAFHALEETVEVINQYFDNIMVMTDQESIRENRLNQMKGMANTVNLFANFQSIVFS